MVRSIVLVVVLVVYCSPAQAFTLAFTDAAEISIPTNGGIWVTGYAEAKDCTFTLHRGKTKIRLDLVSTTDRDREFSRPNHFLLPRKPLKKGMPYIMRFRCSNTWRDTFKTTFNGPAIEFYGTGEPDITPPIWEAQPVNTRQKPMCAICGNSTMEFSMVFSTLVRDESPVRIHATLWKDGSQAPTTRIPLIDGRFNVATLYESSEPLEINTCYQISICATDFAGNQTCLGPQPFVRVVESCWANQDINDAWFPIDAEVRDQWCEPAVSPDKLVPRLPALDSLVDAREEDRLQNPLLLGACVVLLLLLFRLRRQRLARAQLGQL